MKSWILAWQESFSSSESPIWDPQPLYSPFQGIMPSPSSFFHPAPPRERQEGCAQYRTAVTYLPAWAERWETPHCLRKKGRGKVVPMTSWLHDFLQSLCFMGEGNVFRRARETRKKLLVTETGGETQRQVMSSIHQDQVTLPGRLVEQKTII
jgi:hypothetical protein